MWSVFSGMELGVWLSDLDIGTWGRRSYPTDGSFLDLGAAILLCDAFNVRDYGELKDPFDYSCPSAWE